MDALTLFYTLLNLIILFMVIVSFAMNREYVILILGTTSLFVISMIITFNIVPYFSKHRHYELLNRRVGKHKKNFYLFLCVCLVSLSWILVYTQNNIGIVKFISFTICLPWLIYVFIYHICTNDERDTNSIELLDNSVINDIKINSKISKPHFTISDEEDEENLLDKNADDGLDIRYSEESSNGETVSKDIHKVSG